MQREKSFWIRFRMSDLPDLLDCPFNISLSCQRTELLEQAWGCSNLHCVKRRNEFTFGPCACDRN